MHACRGNGVPVGAFLRCSGGQRRGPPRLLVANHGVEHAQQVTHAGGHGHLAGFAVGLEARIERLEGRDRKSVVKGKRVSVRVDLGGRRIIKKKKKCATYTTKLKTN